MNTFTATLKPLTNTNQGRILLASITALIIVASTILWVFSHTDTPEGRHSKVQPMTSQELNSIPATNTDGVSGQPFLPDAPPPQRPSGEDPIKIVVNTQNGKQYTAPIDPMCLTDGNGQCDNTSGVFHPPTDVGRIGWWNLSAQPGDTDRGSIVLAGHVDYGGQRGFAALVQTLNEGDTITLTTGSGFEHTYRVDGRSTLVGKNMSPEEYVAATQNTINKKNGQDFVTLISCGGRFVGGVLGYESNEIITAHPI